MGVPVKELKELENQMRELADTNNRDMQDYLMNNKYYQYLQARAHKDTNEFWAERVRELIERYKI